MVKSPPAVHGDPVSISVLGKTPWGREWQPTPVFLPGEFRGQRSLQSMGSQPTVHGVAEESDATERLALTHLLCGMLGMHTVEEARLR